MWCQIWQQTNNQGQARTKQGQAGMKQAQQGQNRDGRDKTGKNRYKTGTSRYKTGTAMCKALRTTVHYQPSLSLFCPCTVCPCFVTADLALLICPFVSLFYPCSVFASFVPVLSLFVFPLFVLDLSLLVLVLYCLVIIFKIIIIVSSFKSIFESDQILPKLSKSTVRRLLCSNMFQCSN